MTQCQCTHSGYCSRHGIHKTNHLVNLCQTDKRYFNAWESGRGPGQSFETLKHYTPEELELRKKASKEGQLAWIELFTKVHTLDDLCRWARTIPEYGCDCRPFFETYLRNNRPENNISFEWKWKLKSAVNFKLKKDDLSLQEASVVFGPPYKYNNPIRTDIVAVTSISPKKHSLDRQQKCIQSWINHGLKVYARNTIEEIRQLEKDFQYINWIEDNDLCLGYSFPTQKIRNLAQTSIELDTPILLINSDCELKGPSDWLQFNEETQFAGIRWNYDRDQPYIISEFRWGIDAYSFTPKQASFIPEDFIFGIGHSMWDYAMPVVMQFNNIQQNFVHHPFLFHENHVQNWDDSSWFIGRDWLHKHYNVFIEFGSPDFRNSLEPNYRYSHYRYLKVK